MRWSVLLWIHIDQGMRHRTSGILQKKETPKVESLPKKWKGKLFGLKFCFDNLWNEIDD